MPGIHPFFYIGTDALNHTEEYTEAAGMAAHVCQEQKSQIKKTELNIDKTLPAFFSSHNLLASIYSMLLFFSPLNCSVPGAEKAQLGTLRTAKALAMTAADVACCPGLLRQVREDFKLAKQKEEK